MYPYQRTGHEEKEVRILLWIRQVWQVLRITVKNTVTAMDMALKM